MEGYASMTGYNSDRHKRPGSESRENDRQRTTDGGSSDESVETGQESEADGSMPDTDDSDDDCDPDPPATGGEAGGGEEDVPAWKEYGYPRKPKWAPDCPRCGGPILGVTIAGPGVSQVTPCGCNVAPSDVEIL